MANYFNSLNRGTWRYASIPDLLAIVKSAFITAVVFTIVLFMFSRADNLPRSVPPLAFLFSVFGMSGSRLLLPAHQGKRPPREAAEAKCRKAHQKCLARWRQ